MSKKFKAPTTHARYSDSETCSRDVSLSPLHANTQYVGVLGLDTAHLCVMHYVHGERHFPVLLCLETDIACLPNAPSGLAKCTTALQQPLGEFLEESPLKKSLSRRL